MPAIHFDGAKISFWDLPHKSLNKQQIYGIEQSKFERTLSVERNADVRES
jgi:hypothetical protein